MISDVAAVLRRHDPGKWRRTLAYRAKRDLPYDASKVPPDAALLLDTTVYIDHLKGDLPTSVVDLIATRAVHHGTPALSELAAAIGYLDPRDPRTAANVRPIMETLERIPAQMVTAPSDEGWIEASLVAAILIRIQGIPKADRRKYLNDAFLFMIAAETGAILITRNSREFDLLLQIKPGVSVLLYDRPRD